MRAGGRPAGQPADSRRRGSRRRRLSSAAESVYFRHRAAHRRGRARAMLIDSRLKRSPSLANERRDTTPVDHTPLRRRRRRRRNTKMSACADCAGADRRRTLRFQSATTQDAALCAHSATGKSVRNFVRVVVAAAAIARPVYRRLGSLLQKRRAVCDQRRQFAFKISNHTTKQKLFI